MTTANRAVIVLALVTASGCRSTPDALVVGSVVSRYAVTYRVVDDGRVSTQRLTVNRPFASRVLLERGERITALGRLATRTDGPWTLLEIPPASAGSDLRPDIAVAAAMRLGLLERRGTRTVGGRRCQLYRAGDSVAGGALSRAKPSRRRHTDFCLGRGSIVLEQEEVEDGKTVRHLRATEVEIGASVVDVPAIPDIEPLGVDVGGGRSRLVDVALRPPFDRFYLLPVLPAGFAHVGRYAVVPPGLAGTTSTIADVYVKGADVLIVDQGASRSGEPPFDRERPTYDVDVAPLGPAEMVVDLRANELRAELPDDGFVRVLGTLTPEELIAIAKTLTLQPKEPA